MIANTLLLETPFLNESQSFPWKHIDLQEISELPQN